MRGRGPKHWVRQPVHLARRFFGALSRQPPPPDDEAWASEFLLPGEAALWAAMENHDRRHSVMVARRFHSRRPDATREEMAGALLHDVGKIESDLGVFGRVAATLVGPRGKHFRIYHDHEAIGARLAADAGSDAHTVALIAGTPGTPGVDDLHHADNI